MLQRIVSLLIAAAAAATLLVPAAASAHSGHDEEHAAQNRALLAAVVLLGGGPEHFHAATLRQVLARSSADEEARLRAQVGSAMVDRFDTVFTYVVDDGIAVMRRQGAPLPAPLATDPKAVATAMYRAGVHNGAFDVEYLFDTLFSTAVHAHAMVAVGRKYGQDGETAYHVVLARLVQDVGAP